ncbi:potassium channel family protein [Leptolyngbya sp. 7M]|uniref:potassium channel family protein n=1 Tax=Leptolyngbya sp. 7M TaxID=2812896 RepID=UPI001B8C3392|nr:NAD-binding protein [Leptolyngbya sp. 7M]QYO67014.1 NAD-binding protein [Leptolyngbya sp. 7M]
MKFLVSQVSYFLSQTQSRQNISALLKYLVFLGSVIVLYSVLFHLLMVVAEGRYYSWLTGFYWTLTVMTTLGFGDITFESDIGRAFSILVLLSGVVLLLIMLPFAFIRYFYAPWLEAQIHVQCPREVPPDVTGHVLICNYDTIAPSLIKRLNQNDIPYYVIEEDAAEGARLNQSGISAVTGKIDARSTYERLRARHALLVFANLEDTINTNITLTVREAAPNVPIAAIVSDPDSIDILELSGANHVLPLKQRLGEYLANRISVGEERAHVIGSFGNWLVVEFTVHNTSLKGKKIRETEIRERTGMNIIGIWQRGRLVPAEPDHTLGNFDVPLAVGTEDQVRELERFLEHDEPLSDSVLILGGGKVGRAAAVALKKKGLTVFMVEQEPGRCDVICDSLDRLTVGDAADRETLMRGGLMESSLVLLTTNDDAVNIYLSIYCRKLKPDVRIISRITYDRNIEAIHRAGADFVLSYAPLGAESVMALVQGRQPIIMGEGVEFFVATVPPSLAGRTLLESGIGSKTGLIVLAIEVGSETIENPSPDTKLPAYARLDLLGTAEQMQAFRELFGAGKDLNGASRRIT